ncbi:MAG: dTDP-4-dehydrorhamnose 3,5-epimerase family protein [Tabrizicola sp.]|uniref:dTDP-4-dehydrorhamnose 3,5-epimerase family protein n=1 Tax=Tabrizicola sp. TaxID=2005166 RepID=UPI002ABB73AF|nr:dTDP-4-dehydrorhamnose 3,5-epimerase family protein [Tabrizicola sp.]MDZ4089328.1 dTDP-4-dehydrorhamnose 3,5-epimerase family protein [Tabrizicola sp.]
MATIDRVTLEDFVDDRPWLPEGVENAEVRVENQIAGVELRRLEQRADGRGNLVVLMSDRFGESYRTPHVYLVTAAARSVRAWVYHKRQSDRLAYTQGRLRVVLYDLRPDSPTHQVLNVLEVGAANKVLLTIPPFVVHAVQNLGDEDSCFVNMPTRAYDPANPDKSRLPKDHPGIPYRFE